MDLGSPDAWRVNGWPKSDWDHSKLRTASLTPMIVHVRFIHHMICAFSVCQAELGCEASANPTGNWAVRSRSLRRAVKPLRRQRAPGLPEKREANSSHKRLLIVDSECVERRTKDFRNFDGSNTSEM